MLEQQELHSSPPTSYVTQNTPPANPVFGEMGQKAAESLRELGEKREERRKKLDKNDAILKYNSRYAEIGLRRTYARQILQGEGSPPLSPQKSLDFSPGGTPHHDSGMQCCWKVPDFLQQKQKAIARPNIPLTGPLWVCPRGYCLRAYLFPNGHGVSLGSHLSVFMSLVPGRYDDRLKWPATGTISFILLQRERKNRGLRGRTFYVDPDSDFFQRPPKEITDITAAGCPDFLPITEVDKYIENGALFWEFSFNPPDI